jgi:hypothetical protein
VLVPVSYEGGTSSSNKKTVRPADFARLAVARSSQVFVDVDVDVDGVGYVGLVQLSTCAALGELSRSGLYLRAVVEARVPIAAPLWGKIDKVPNRRQQIDAALFDFH